jgi:xanthine dehydrogenase YagS FAD-binding subunit
MKPFAYADATTVEEVVSALDPTCRPLAGGTDLLGLMKGGLAAPGRLVNVKALNGLRAVEEREDAWHVGALATLARLAHLEGVAGEELAILRKASLESATPQLRHAATLGGNLLQRPRCWYFRNPAFHCWLKGGERCYAVNGENRYHAIFDGGPCYIVHPSDPAVALTCLGAKVSVVGPSGGRTIPLDEFYHQPRQGGWSESVLERDELIVAVVVPEPPAGARGAYVKVAERAAWDFALVSAAVQLTLKGDVVQEARVALGGVAHKPWRAPEAEEALVGKGFTDEVVEVAAEAAVEDAHPLGENAYKIDLVRGVLREALRRV